MWKVKTMLGRDDEGNQKRSYAVMNSDGYTGRSTIMAEYETLMEAEAKAKELNKKAGEYRDED